MAHATPTSDNPPPYRIQRTVTPNVLVVGETGVGKSSVINLIGGELLADVSSSATGCTLEATSYDIVLSDNQGLGHHVRLFDTVGLNEPSLSKNGYLVAIEKANVLISELQRTGGIRLLIFCIRGGRITAVTQHNYYLFRHILCQDQVPVAFVITGMEHEQSMEDWWTRNVALFERANLSCSSHVCVTATRGLDNVYDSQYQKSQAAIRKMLLDHMSMVSWKPERNWWFVNLASMLLRWVEKVRHRKGHFTPRKPLKIRDLIRCLELECNFTRGEAEELAGKIWAQRMENSGTDIVKVENVDYLSDTGM